MNNGSFLSPIRLFRYTLTISIYFTQNSKSADMAKNILKDLRCMVNINVLLKSIPDI